MKILIKLLLAGLLLLPLVGCQEVIDLFGLSDCNIFTKCEDSDDEEGTVTDADGNTYRWKVMDDGNKWLVENLRYEASRSWIYPEENYPEGVAYDPELYGRLYGLVTGGDICSEALGEGWFTPRKREWDELVEAYGGWDSAFPARSTPAYEALILGGSSGFEAPLAGTRDPDEFYSLDRKGYYWSGTSEIDEDGFNYTWIYTFSSFSGELVRETAYEPWEYPDFGYSCRCVQD